MAEEQEQDKTEQATPFKLREAKRKGQVAKSMEINSLLVLAAGLTIVYVTGETMVSRQLDLSQVLFSQAHDIHFDPVSSVGLFEELTNRLIDIFWVFMAAVIVVGILANMLQTGPMFTTFPLKPDFKRLNPVTGFKRLFSKKLLFESGKTIVKLFLFSVVLYIAIRSVLPAVLTLVQVSPDVYLAFFIQYGKDLAFKLLAVLLFIALLDLLYTRWDFSVKMRMSRRELKEEVKRREGDPHQRAKMRELQREAAKRSGSIRRVPDADVLITNPTHFAIAIHYERGVTPAPKVIAKGAGELALKMKLAARKHNVPVVENKQLARKLFKTTEIDAYIPEGLYPPVAKILVWVYTLRKQNREARAQV